MFVSVVGSTIEESVAILDSLIDHIRAGLQWHLPKAEAEHRELISTIKDMMGHCVSHGLCTLADCGKNTSSSIERLSRVVSH